MVGCKKSGLVGWRKTKNFQMSSAAEAAADPAHLAVNGGRFWIKESPKKVLKGQIRLKKYYFSLSSKWVQQQQKQQTSHTSQSTKVGFESKSTQKCN